MMSVYSDASFIGAEGRSQAGFLVSKGEDAIFWRSWKESLIAMSTAEAELSAASTAIIAWLGVKSLMEEIEEKPVMGRVWCDNTAAIAIADRNVCSWRTRHVAVRYAFVRSLIESRDIVLKFCGTSDQRADGLTKSLGPTLMSGFRTQLSLRETS